MNVIGIDTSNYTTSIAWYNGVEDVNCSKLLPVRQGELGLRQSDAVLAWRTGSAAERCGVSSYEKPAGAFWQAVFPYTGGENWGSRCQYPSEGGGGELYALLFGGLFPREAPV